ncbi:hypothetical protein [Sciscionella marina]|uniref:hypothetical protein n=1 Tax=Sciscionella marina TaxID=508770 RepID=UPI0003695211|nr:hypothetical protein [Sciscionella marina]
MTDEQTAAPNQRELAAVRGFIAAHGEQVRAVVENIGKAGARVVLVGEDGALGDVVVRGGVEAAEALVAASGLESGSWDGPTVAAVQIGSAHRRAMAGPRAGR